MMGGYRGRGLIAVTGMPGSGKSVVSSIIARELAAPRIVMGDLVREWAREKGYKGPEGVERAAIELRRLYGEEAVAVLAEERARRLGSSLVVVDGVRSLAEVNYFRRRGWRVVIVAVHSPPRLRYERIKARGRMGEDEEAARLRDENNLRLGVGEVIAMADIMIVNDAELAELEIESVKAAIQALCLLSRGNSYQH